MKHALLLGLVVLGLVLPVGYVSAQDCPIPPFVQVGYNYKVETSGMGGSGDIKILELHPQICWMKVEIKTLDPTSGGRRPEVAWINMKSLTLIKAPKP